MLNATYELNGIESPCSIIDISTSGLAMRVKGWLETGDNIKIKFAGETINSTVTKVDGNVVGVKFNQLTGKQLDEIYKILKKSFLSDK